MAEPGKIGVVAATLMVAGNIMGSGIFMLPANLAATGGIAIFGWLATVLGAAALAMTYSKPTSVAGFRPDPAYHAALRTPSQSMGCGDGGSFRDPSGPKRGCLAATGRHARALR